MRMKRREFIGGALASCGLWELGGCRLFRPSDLRFGVLSDIHVRENGGKDRCYGGDATYLRKALEYFRAQDVDAVMIAGDLTDGGRASELKEIAAVWFDVFPEGCGVEKLFVSGNHDWWGMKGVARMKALWEESWREPYESLWHKTVKGYHFLGQHWENYEPCTGAPFDGLGPWLERNGDLVRGRRPFFYVQHPHPKDTCFGEHAWGHDAGNVTAALSAFPNAVAFSGHSHNSHLDERSIWQGSFTSVNTASLRYGGCPDNSVSGRGCENGLKGDGKLMPRYDSFSTKSGLLVVVSDREIVYSRRDFQHDRPLGPDWVQPLPAIENRVFGFAERAGKERPPEFAPEAKVFVRKVAVRPRKVLKDVGPADVVALEIRFPAANAGGARPFTYEISVAGDGAAPLVRSVIAEGFDQTIESPRAQGESVAVLALSSFPRGANAITVTPVSSLGTRGRPLKSGLST